ncbi:hypothetical protein C8J56DRAFT_925905 [Mycena floridula]|nr:hypothetical protein C8J56DRAFT_925905 [Mycena floridula]
MLSTAQQTNASTFRVHLEGVNIPTGFKLPDIELVREEASQVTDVMKSPPQEIEGRNSKNESIGILPVALVYNMLLGNLFKFSYFVHVLDIPSDILPQCMWALEWFIRALHTGSELQLRTLGHILPNQTKELACRFLLANSRFKLATHFLKPEIDRPQDALHHLREALDADAAFLGHKEAWKSNPYLYATYGKALARARVDDIEAKDALTRVVEARDVNPAMSADGYITISCKIYLARVLRRLNANDKQAVQMEQWLVKWLKKNPHRIDDTALAELFTTDLDPKTDPVLIGLGGVQWIDNRKRTEKTHSRLSRICRYCQSSSVKLSQCARCKHIYYCSKECQMAHFPYHKEACKEEAAAMKKIAALEESSPLAARVANDWREWRKQTFVGRDEALAHALNLGRDPERGRTHIIFEAVKYVPEAKKLRDRFRGIKAGVFKIDEVWPEIETALGLSKGEGKGFLQEMLDEFDHVHESEHYSRGPGPGEAHIPIFHLTFSVTNEVQTFLGFAGVSKTQMARLPHDPKWRSKLNTTGPPPEPLQFARKGIRDAEYIF